MRLDSCTCAVSAVAFRRRRRRLSQRLVMERWLSTCAGLFGFGRTPVNKSPPVSSTTDKQPIPPGEFLAQARVQEALLKQLESIVGDGDIVLISPADVARVRAAHQRHDEARDRKHAAEAAAVAAASASSPASTSSTSTSASTSASASSASAPKQ